MPKGQQRIRTEFWAVLIFVALLAYTLIAVLWKKNPVLGWIITGSIVAILAFSIYRFPAFRRLLFRTAKKAGESIAYETAESGREPMPPHIRANILQRAEHRCENPDCRSNVRPEIHHIDGDRNNNRFRNLIALCPNCHTGAGHGEYSNSQLRNWVQRSWETSKRGRPRPRY
jgi:hypothetical protein